MTEDAYYINDEIWGPNKVKIVEGLCICGTKIPLFHEVLHGASFICVKCGVDNSPPDLGWEE